MLFITATSAAAPDFLVSLLGKNIFIQTTQWARADLQVSIKDAQGQVVFDKSFNEIAKEGNLKLNVSNLSYGDYEVILTNWQKTQKQHFSILGNKTVLSTDVTTSYKPQFKYEKGKLKVNFLNINQNAFIKILDPSNRIIYEAPIKETMFAQSFKLENAEAGEYTVHITQNDTQYWYSFDRK